MASLRTVKMQKETVDLKDNTRWCAKVKASAVVVVVVLVELQAHAFHQLALFIHSSSRKGRR